VYVALFRRTVISIQQTAQQYNRENHSVNLKD